MDAAQGARTLVRGAILLLLVAPAIVRGQQLELRTDVTGPAPASVQPGIGLTFSAGYYARITAATGYSLESRTDLAGNRWRGDLITRFLFDPFRQQRWGFSVGGGLSFRRRTYLAAVLDLEGPQVHGVLPAVQVGVSGGVRAALVLRRAIPERR